MMSRKVRLLTGSILLAICLSGCFGGVSAKSIGPGPWPRYKEPEAVNFTVEEAFQLDQWRNENKNLFDKIMAQEHEYRTIVKDHNKAALKHNRDLVEKFTDCKPEDIQE